MEVHPQPRRPHDQLELETLNRLRRRVARTARLPAWLTVETAVEAVMCTLTQRLTAGEAHRLLSSAPPAIRPLFDACVFHRDGVRTTKLDRADFLDVVADHLDVTPAHAELVCSAVFAAVRSELAEDVVDKIASQLPGALEELWSGPPLAAPDLDVSIPIHEIRRAFEVDLEWRAKLPPTVTASRALGAVICMLSRRLSGGEARHLLLGLPTGLRDLVGPCTIHRPEHADQLDERELLRGAADDLGLSLADAERVVREVIRATKRVIPRRVDGEIASQLPPDLRELWEAPS